VVSPDDIFKKGRGNAVSKTKGLISYWGVKTMGLPASEAASRLKITREAVRQNAQNRKACGGAEENPLILLS